MKHPVKVRLTNTSGGVPQKYVGQVFDGQLDDEPDYGSGVVCVYLSDEDSKKVGLPYQSLGLGWNCEIVSGEILGKFDPIARRYEIVGAQRTTDE